MKTKGSLRPRDIDLAKGAEKLAGKRKDVSRRTFRMGEGEESRWGADSVMEAVGRPSMLRIQHPQRVTRIPQELLREQADVCGTVTHGVCWLTQAAPALRGRGRRIVRLTTSSP